MSLSATRAPGHCALVALVAVLSVPMAEAEPTDPPGKQGALESETTPDSGEGRRREAEALQVFEIGEVVVTGRRRSNLEQAATTTVVTSEEIRARGQRSLDEAVELIPGLQLYTHTKGHRRLRLRGFELDKVLILVDGAPLNDVFATDLDLSMIPADSVSKIVVNRGVSSALYGTDGAIGAINVVTRRPAELFVEASAEYGLYDNSTVTLAHGMPVGDFYYWVNGSIRTSGGFIPSGRLDRAARRRWFDKLVPYELYGQTFEQVTFPAKEQYLTDSGLWDHQGLDRYSVSAKVGYDSGSVEAGLSAGFQFQEGETNTFFGSCYSDYNIAKAQWRTNRGPWFGDEVASTKDFAMRERAFVWPGSYRVTVSPYAVYEKDALRIKLTTFLSWSHQEQVGYASADHRYSKDQAAIFSDRRADPWEPFRDLKWLNGYGFRIVPSVRFAKGHRLTGSVHWRYETLYQEDQALSALESPTISSLMGAEPYPVRDLGLHHLSVAVEDELKLFGTLKLSAGVSYDAQFVRTFDTRSGMDYGELYLVRDQGTLMGTRDAVNPVLGVVYDPVKRLLRLRGAASIKARFPRLNEYAKITGESLDTDLRPERSYNVNAGLELFFADKALSLRADYFMALVDDRIAKINRDDPPVNIERMTTHGAEVTIVADFPGVGGFVDLAGHVGYTFLHSRNHDNSAEEAVNMGDEVEFLPPHQLTFDVRLAFRFGTTLSFWGRYFVGARQYVMAAAPLQTAPFSTDYFTTVALNDPLMLNLRLAHQLTEHVEGWVMVTNLLDHYDIDPLNPGPGRMFRFGLRVAL